MTTTTEDAKTEELYCEHIPLNIRTKKDPSKHPPDEIYLRENTFFENKKGNLETNNFKLNKQ